MDDKKFDEMYQATMENNSMLKSMRRSAYVGGIFKVVWWGLILIVLPYLTWIYIQPYLDQVLQQYNQVQGTSAEYSAQADQIKGAFGGNIDWQKLYNQYFGTTTAK